jgi:hypothetical protein
MARLHLVLLRWKIKIRRRFASIAAFHVPHDRVSQFLAVEILSFASLFGIAMGLLEYHRFYAAIVLFSLGCLILGLRLLIACFLIGNRFKWLTAILVVLGTISGTNYLVGVVIQAESEYYATIEQTDEAMSVAAPKKLPTKNTQTLASPEHGPPPSVLSIRALATNIAYPDGTKIAGIDWKKNYGFVRLTVDIPKDEMIHDLQLAVQIPVGGRIFDAGQLSDISGVEFHPPEPPDVETHLQAKSGGDITVSSRDDFEIQGIKMSGRMWNIFCPRLEGTSELRLVLATATDQGSHVIGTNLHITGNYELKPSLGNIDVPVDETVPIQR